MGSSLDWEFDPGPVLVSPNALTLLDFSGADWLVYNYHVKQKERRTTWNVHGWAVLVATRGKEGQTYTSVVLWEERKRWRL